MKTDSLKQIIEEAIKRQIKNAIVENTTAEVYVIKNKETGEAVAIKKFKEEDDDDAELLFLLPSSPSPPFDRSLLLFLLFSSTTSALTGKREFSRKSPLLINPPSILPNASNCIYNT